MAGIPEFRQSQGIVPYGVGSIVDFPEDSLMAAGLDMWPSETPESDAEYRAGVIRASEIIDTRLQARLSAGRVPRVARFLAPIEAPEKRGFFQVTNEATISGFMPFVRFPLWHFCPRCRLMTRVAWNAPMGDSRLRCSGQQRLRGGQGKVCESIPERFRPRLIPVRFAVACRRGHIMDFPWLEWAHGTKRCTTSTALFLHSTGRAGLDGVKITCTCGAGRTLRGAFGRHVFDSIWDGGCPGHRPWLGPDARLLCSEEPRTIQRGASNTYFPKIVSSILIPPHSETVRQILSRPDIWELIQEVPRVDGEVPPGFLEKIAQRHGVDTKVLREAVSEKLSQVEEPSTSPQSEEEYRHSEYRAFRGARPARRDRNDFDIISREPEKYSAWFRDYVSAVVLAVRLRETRVLTGFSRLEPPEVVDSEQLSALSLVDKSWLPGVAVRGEGLFLALNEKALGEWESENSLRDRAGVLCSRFTKYLRSRNLPPREVGPRFFLVHTLAHVLIRQLTFDCGYDSTSLRERLYVSSDPEVQMCGLLIYTASGDAEGTLGGLVRQGEPGRLEVSLRAAIRNASLCSSDPLCIESEGQGSHSLNLASCHACSLLPETTCEEGNRLLDRGMLIGTIEGDGVGFFQELLATT